MRLRTFPSVAVSICGYVLVDLGQGRVPYAIAGVGAGAATAGDGYILPMEAMDVQPGTAVGQ